MKIRFFQKLYIVSIVFLFSVSGCATTYSFERENPDVMARYLSMPTEKALATFRISNSNYGYGYGENYATIEEAKKRAMDECQSRQQNHDDVEEPCVIYMVNNEKITKSGGGN